MDVADAVRIKEEVSEDQPCVMNTSEDARSFWDEVACVINSDPRMEKRNLVPMSEEVASSRRLPIVTEHLNNFLTRVDKVRRVGPEFISKFVLMFNGFVNLWRKDNGLPPLINLDDDDCLNNSNRKFGLDVSHRSTSTKSYNMATGNTMKILPKSDISQKRDAPKRSLDGQIRCQSSPALPLLKPKFEATSVGNVLSGVQTTSGTVTMTSPSVSGGAFTQVSTGSTVRPSGPVPVSQIFIRLPNGQLSPQGQLIVDSTKIRHGINPVTSQPMVRQNMAPNLVTGATASKHVVNIPSVNFLNQALQGFDPNSALVLPQSTSVMTSLPVSRESPSPARKLARIAPAPSRGSSSPVSPFRGHNNELEKAQNQNDSEVFEAAVSVVRNFETDSFETNVTVDKANGQGCISDINKRCAKGEISLRDILKLGNFKHVKFEDLVLSFDQNSTQSNVKLNLKFKQS